MLHNHAFYPADTTRKELERRAMKMPMEAHARQLNGWAIVEGAVIFTLVMIFFVVCFLGMTGQ